MHRIRHEDARGNHCGVLVPEALASMIAIQTAPLMIVAALSLAKVISNALTQVVPSLNFPFHVVLMLGLIVSIIHHRVSDSEDARSHVNYLLTTEAMDVQDRPTRH